jgi:hypothetical protein
MFYGATFQYTSRPQSNTATVCLSFTQTDLCAETGSF